MRQPEFPFVRRFPKTKETQKYPCEFNLSVICLREVKTYDELPIVDSSQQVRDFWHAAVKTSPCFRPEVENFVVIFLNSRNRLKGFHLLAHGYLDTVVCVPREVFRCAIGAAASGIIIGHNHPSGDPSPSDADLRMTRDLIRAGQLLKIEVIDSVILGLPSLANPKDYLSLRDMGYFHA